ncbi:MAG TPA: SdrD B-like domain-containing protein [Anaerolineae bacterium]|nr:SdrD B-like domain-containing protein [Anaerolineae bacterium]
MNSTNLPKHKARPLILAIALIAGILTTTSLAMTLWPTQSAQAAGISVTINAGYNLVVDSNVESPSTYAPSVATVMGTFCNTTGSAIDNVQAYIGDFTAGTPGVYPSREPGVGTFNSDHPMLAANTAAGTTYQFTHVGGQAGTGDATRFLGTLAAGECRTQYWHFTYPRRANLATTGDNAGIAIFGQQAPPEDDLYLYFDMWAEDGTGAATGNDTWRMHMRSEISANANKIRPNPDGVWFNTDVSKVQAGSIITSNGVKYEIGVVNKGFDNDGFTVDQNGNVVPSPAVGDEDDYNLWLQPVGDPAYDPTCFRLIRTTGALTISVSAGPDLIYPFTDRLYFSAVTSGTLDIPELLTNNGVEGYVKYTFIALGGPCTTILTPYQEVASGDDEEKFNGDYGAGVPPLLSSEPAFTMTKASDPNVIALGGTVSYEMPYGNTNSTPNPPQTDLGLSLGSGGPTLNYSDTIPAGMEYVSGTAYGPGTEGVDYFLQYSTDNGASWVFTEPIPASSVTTLRWVLTEELGAGETGTIGFDAIVPGTYAGDPFIVNEVCASLDTGPDLACATDVVMVQGSNQIGDTVWQDENNNSLQDAGENGIPNVSVYLYYDNNGDGLLDANDMLITSTVTDANGNYLFDLLPNGNFLVTTNDPDTDDPPNFDPDVPTGYNYTTPEVVAVTGLGTTITSPYLDADFGFGPVLGLTKNVVSGGPDGAPVIFNINVINNRPGDGTGVPKACVYYIWPNVVYADNSNPSGAQGGNNAGAQWTNTQNVSGPPDDTYMLTDLSDNPDAVGLSGFNIGPQLGNITNVSYVSYIREIANFKAGDQLIVDVYSGTTVISSTAYTGASFFTNPAGTDYVLVRDATAAQTNWDWADFTGELLDVELTADKGGGGGASGDIGIDAFGFIITTDQTCGSPNDTIDPAPLVDTYDADRLQFVSANPPVSSVTTGGTDPYANTGTLTWDNIGPLYGGQIKRVQVTFLALEPTNNDPADTDNDPTVTTNTASITTATFLNGVPTNNITDTAPVTVTPAGSIGDLVWNDIVGDGIHDPDGADNILGTPDDEVGIAGVTVILNNGSCTPATTCPRTVTDENGYYLFSGLADGTYVVTVNTTTLPNGGTGAVNTDDRDADDDSNSGNIVLNNNDSNPNNNDILDADFGYTIPAMIQGNIWHDWNRNGADAPDTGEEDLAGVTVQLFGGACSPCTTTTDANGYYVFPNLTPAAGPAGTTYQVVVNPTTGDMSTGTWAQSYDHPNGPDGIPGNGDDATNLDNAVFVTIVPGGIGEADFSYYGTGADVGDTLYVDWNGDGTQDPGEEGIPNVTVWIYEDQNGDGIIDPDTDTLIMTDTTDANGNYLFPDLPGDDYIVVVDTTDPDFPSYLQPTGDPDQPGVPCTTCDNQSTVTTNGTADSLNEDFGYQPVGIGQIGDYVWIDTDRDGIQDANELGRDNITVELYEDANGNGVIDAEDALISTTVTSGGGYYLFENLLAASGGTSYLVNVDTTDADLPTDAFSGTQFQLTTNNDPESVTLTPAAPIYLDADFGFGAPGRIGDFVWQDSNGDGLYDFGVEPGIAGVVLTLTLATGEFITTTTTDANGYYLFTGLVSDTYRVEVDTSTLPANFFPTSDPDESYTCVVCDHATTYPIDLPAGQFNYSADFGYQPLNTIGDYVWLDINGDGVQDPNEPPIPGVVVTLTLQGGGIVTTTTDVDGLYVFSGVPDGVHTVDNNVSPEFNPTFDADGGFDNTTTIEIVGAVITTTQNAWCPTPAPSGDGNCNYDIDFGVSFNGPYAITGTVFSDAGMDGGDYITGTDTALTGIPVYLFWDADGPSGPAGYVAIYTATTTADGYEFTGLPTGSFAVSTDPNFAGLPGALTTNGNNNDGSAYEFVSLGTDPATDNRADGNPAASDDNTAGFVDFGFTPGPTAVTLGQTLANSGATPTSLFVIFSGLLFLTLFAVINRRRQYN